MTNDRDDMDGMTSFVQQGLDVVFYNWRGLFAPSARVLNNENNLRPNDCGDEYAGVAGTTGALWMAADVFIR